MTKASAASIILAIVLTIGCKPTAEPTASSNTSTTVTGTKTQTTPVALPPAPAGLTATLQNDAYHYYGLGRTKPENFIFQIAGQDPQPGTETVKFKGMVGDKARFEIHRTGGVANMGEYEEVLLSDKGVNIVSTKPGILTGSPLILPASLATGATWTTDYSVVVKGKGAMKPNAKGELVATDSVSKDHSTFKVVGPQQVVTKAGTFDAILVESEGDESLDRGNGPEKFKLKTQAWYVKGRGAVKITLSTEQGTQSTSLSIEAAGDDTKP